MCVPHSQRQFVGAAQAELRELKLQMLEEAEADGGGYPVGYPDWYDAQQTNLPNIPSQFNPFNPTNPGAGANPNAPGGGSNPYGNVPGIGTPMFRGASAELQRRLTLGRMVEREIFQQMQLEQMEQFGAMQGAPEQSEPTDPAYLRLRALQKRFGTVMEHIQQNKATQADVTELTDIMTALEREYAGYPPPMQEQVKESKDRLVMHIRKLRDELQDKINKQKNGNNEAINQQQRFSTMAAVASSSLRDLLSSASAMQTGRWGGSRFGYGVPSTRERSGGDRWGSRYSGDGRFGMGERIGYVGAEPRQLTSTGRPVPQRYTPSHLSLTEEGSSADFHAAAIEVPGQDPGSIYWTAAVGSFGSGRSNWGRPGMGSSWGVGSGWPRTAFVSRAGGRR